MLTYQWTRLVPAIEDVCDLIAAHTHTSMHDAPGFAQGTHYTVLDAIVYHLDVVTSTTWTDLCHTWVSMLVLGCDLFEEGHEGVKSPLVTTRHQRGAVACTTEPSRYTHANVCDT